MRLRELGLVVVGIVVSACGATSGTFGDEGFVHARYPYRVHYSEPASQTFVNRDWRIDNYYRKGKALEPKSGAEWETEWEFDCDGDEQTDRGETALTYDLLLESARKEQALWIRTLPLSQTYALKELPVLMREYLDRIAGVGYARVTLSVGLIQIEQRRFAVETLATQPVTVGDREGLLVIADVADVDQIKLTPTDRRKRAALLFIRTRYRHWVPCTVKGKEFPVLMIVGYVSNPADFESGVAAYRHFVSQIELSTQPARLGTKEPPHLSAFPAGVRLGLPQDALSIVPVPASAQPAPAAADPAADGAAGAPAAPAPSPGAATSDGAAAPAAPTAPEAPAADQQPAAP